MDPRTLIIGIGSVFCLSHVARGKTVSTVITRADKNVRPNSGEEYSYPTPILYSDVLRRYLYNKVHRQKEYHWRNHPIFAFGVSHFLSYAAHFCKYETENGSLEVVSVGSGYGAIESDIIATYADHFGGELSITLVDPDENCRVDFRTVDDLVAKRANVLRNCVLLIIWPEVQTKNDGYDIRAIRKLQPRAVLTMYETTGVSGSLEFLACLNPPACSWANSEECSSGLDYSIEEIAYQEVHSDPTWNTPIEFGCVSYKFRLVKMRRKD